MSEQPDAVAQARAALVRVLQAAHISCEPGTFYDLAATLGVPYPPTEHQIADAVFAAVRAECAAKVRGVRVSRQSQLTGAIVDRPAAAVVRDILAALEAP